MKYKEIEESNDDNSYLKSLYYIVVRRNHGDVNTFNNKDLEVAANLIYKLNIRSDRTGRILRTRLKAKMNKYNETLNKYDDDYWDSY